MSNFQPYSAGDHYAWQMAQTNTPPPTGPPPLPPPTRAEADVSRAWELGRQISKHPDLPQVVATIATRLLETYPDRAEDHVVDVEYRSGPFSVRTSGRAAAFKVWPCGVFQVAGPHETVLDSPLAIRADGNLYRSTGQNANVKLLDSMSWSDYPAYPIDTNWRGHLAVRLAAELPEKLRPDLWTLVGHPATSTRPTTAATQVATPSGQAAVKPAASARRISRRAARKADRIRRKNVPTVIQINDLSSIYENTHAQGWRQRNERRALRRLARLRAKSDRAFARARKLDGLH